MKKYCKDCIYCINLENEEFLKCSCKKNPTKTDYATGKKSLRWSFCSILREHNFISMYFFGTCGKTGRYFEPKREK